MHYHHHRQLNHQSTYQQFPNFTQPPPPIEPSLPPIDDSIIEKFLTDRNHLTIQTNSEDNAFNQKTVNAASDRLNVIQTNLNNLIERQTSDENNLKTNVAHLSPAQWQDKINSLKQNQIKIAELLTKFETLTSEPAKSTATERREKKRRRNKRKTRRIQHSNTTQGPTSTNIQESAPNRPKFADDLAQSYEQYELDRLRTANFRRASECKRQLSLLDSLIELRCIRRKNSNASGSGNMASERHFVEQIDQLKAKWNDALAKCNAQENKIKNLLTNTSSQLWWNALFSNTEQPFADNAMDFKSLLDIRKSWDLCLVTDENGFGSSIPPGWVLPNSTPSEEWASYVV